MKNFLRITLLLSSVLFFFSCNPGGYFKLKKNTADSAELTPIFKGVNKAQIYRAGMKFKDFEFGGQLVFRQMKEDVFRVVIMSEIGVKFLDIELTPTERIVHQINEQINRPLVLNVLESDFRLLLMNDIQSYKSSTKKNVNHKTIYKLKKRGKGKRFYYINDETGKLDNIEKASKFGNKKVLVQLENYKEGIPKNISIEHFGLPLSLILEKVK